MAYKKQAEKFGPQNKAQIRGRVKHTRTGACTCKRAQKCFHGKNYGRAR